MNIIDPRSIRKRLGLNQVEFWSRVGVTQSGGSRYENGRALPRSLQELMRIVYVVEVDLEKVTRQDIEILSYLKTAKPALYRQLRAKALKAA
ncbi:MAG TPA: hypothetical protein VHB46_04520 [Burkholderiales bacterium]|nr:hypothetical protein [Burkholderiales bacterium]